MMQFLDYHKNTLVVTLSLYLITFQALGSRLQPWNLYESLNDITAINILR
jgi:hypothetical protein